MYSFHEHEVLLIYFIEHRENSNLCIIKGVKWSACAS